MQVACLHRKCWTFYYYCVHLSFRSILRERASVAGGTVRYAKRLVAPIK